MTDRRVRTPRGVTVTLPTGDTAAVFTDTTTDAAAIRDLLQAADCQTALFDYTPDRNGAFSR